MPYGEPDFIPFITGFVQGVVHPEMKQIKEQIAQFQQEEGRILKLVQDYAYHSEIQIFFGGRYELVKFLRENLEAEVKGGRLSSEHMQGLHVALQNTATLPRQAFRSAETKSVLRFVHEKHKVPVPPPIQAVFVEREELYAKRKEKQARGEPVEGSLVNRYGVLHRVFSCYVWEVELSLPDVPENNHAFIDEHWILYFFGADDDGTTKTPTAPLPKEDMPLHTPQGK